MANIAIIGAGEIGQAIGGVLSSSGHDVCYWDKEESKISRFGPILSLPDIVGEAQYVFLTVPSWAVHEALAFTAPYLKKKTGLICLSKGLNDRVEKTMDEVLKKMLPAGVPFAVLGGAMIAEELMAGKMGTAVVASTSSRLTKDISLLFSGTLVILDVSRDVRGVTSAGVLKNIYALGLGITEGLSWGHNEQGYFFGQAEREMARLVNFLGGKKETIAHPAIVADFVATGFSRDSLNHRAGLELCHDANSELKSEGMVSLPVLVKILGRQKLETYPLLYTLARVVVGKVPAKQAFSDLQTTWKS